MQSTYERRRAAYAKRCVDAVTDDAALFAGYVQATRDIGARIMINGLGQTIAFILGKKDNKGQLACLADLSRWCIDHLDQALTGQASAGRSDRILENVPSANKREAADRRQAEQFLHRIVDGELEDRVLVARAEFLRLAAWQKLFATAKNASRAADKDEDLDPADAGTVSDGD